MSATMNTSIYTESVISGGCFVFICLCILSHLDVKLEAKELSDGQSIHRRLSIHLGTTQSPTIAVTLGCSDRNLFGEAWGLIPEPFYPYRLSWLDTSWGGPDLSSSRGLVQSEANHTLTLQQLTLIIIANTGPHFFSCSLAQTNA